MRQINPIIQEIINSKRFSDLKQKILLYRRKFNVSTMKFEIENEPIDITKDLIKTGTLTSKLDTDVLNKWDIGNLALTLKNEDNQYNENSEKSYFQSEKVVFPEKITFYDAISDTYLTKTGTGTAIFGTDSNGDYIQASGQFSFGNLGVSINQNSKIRMKYIPTIVNNSFSGGSIGGGGVNARFIHTLAVNQSGWFPFFMFSQFDPSSNPLTIPWKPLNTLPATFEIELSKNGGDLNGTKIEDFTGYNNFTAGEIGLSGSSGTIKFYYIEIWQDGNLIRNFKPVNIPQKIINAPQVIHGSKLEYFIGVDKEDKKGFPAPEDTLYDTVSKTFLTKLGTGNINYGEDTNGVYLKFNGNAWFDSGINGDFDTKVICDADFEVDTGVFLFGARGNVSSATADAFSFHYAANQLLMQFSNQYIMSPFVKTEIL